MAKFITFWCHFSFFYIQTWRIFPSFICTHDVCYDRFFSSFHHKKRPIIWPFLIWYKSSEQIICVFAWNQRIDWRIKSIIKYAYLENVNFKKREISLGTPEVCNNSQVTPHIWRIHQIPLNFVFGFKTPLSYTKIQVH